MTVGELDSRQEHAGMTVGELDSRQEHAGMTNGYWNCLSGTGGVAVPASVPPSMLISLPVR
jgi:hypothetical protein